MQKLTPVSQLFSESWSLYKKHWKQWVLILLVPVALNVILSILGLASSVTLPIFVTVVVFLMALVQMWAELSLLTAVAGHQKKMDVATAYKKSWKQLGAFLTLTVVLTLVLLGAFVLLIIPGIILSLYFSFSLWALVDQNAQGFKAMLTSKELVKGFWWPVFGRFVLLAVVMGLLYYILSTALQTVGIPYFEEITGAVVSLTAGPTAVAYSYLIYKNLKSIKGTSKLVPTTGQKTGLILLAILGFVVPVVMVAAGAFLVLNFASEGLPHKEFLMNQDGWEEKIQEELELQLNE